MYKKAVCLFIVLTLSLSACSSLTDDIANTSEDTPAPPTESGGEAEPDEPSAPGGEEQPTEPNAEAPPEGFTVFPEGEYLEEKFRTSDPLPGDDAVDASFRGVMYWANQQLVVADGVTHYRSDLFAFPLDGSEPYTVFQAMDAGFPYVCAHGDELVIICDRSADATDKGITPLTCSHTI